MCVCMGSSSLTVRVCAWAARFSLHEGGFRVRVCVGSSSLTVRVCVSVCMHILYCEGRFHVRVCVCVCGRLVPHCEGVYRGA